MLKVLMPFVANMGFPWGLWVQAWLHMHMEGKISIHTHMHTFPLPLELRRGAVPVGCSVSVRGPCCTVATSQGCPPSSLLENEGRVQGLHVGVDAGAPAPCADGTKTHMPWDTGSRVGETWTLQESMNRAPEFGRVLTLAGHAWGVCMRWPASAAGWQADKLARGW
jgi:hypothetical protein